MTDLIDFVRSTLQIDLEPWQEELLRGYAAGGLLSSRTRAGLAAAKARGVKLGGYRGAALSDEARRKGTAARRAIADEHAMMVFEEAGDILAAEGGTLRQTADALNERGVPTPSGNGRWSATTVSRLVKRLASMGKAGEPAGEETWLD